MIEVHVHVKCHAGTLKLLTTGCYHCVVLDKGVMDTAQAQGHVKLEALSMHSLRALAQ